MENSSMVWYLKMMCKERLINRVLKVLIIVFIGLKVGFSSKLDSVDN